MHLKRSTHARFTLCNRLASADDVPDTRWLSGMQLGVCPLCARRALASSHLRAALRTRDERAFFGAMLDVAEAIEAIDNAEETEKNPDIFPPPID